jgi:hypothetical protein
MDRPVAPPIESTGRRAIPDLDQVAVGVPSGPPVLTPKLARALLAVLRASAPSINESTECPSGDVAS